MENINKKDILKKLISGYALPSLSIIAVKLIELATDDNSSMDELADLIEKDPSLTVRVLKLANSAFFKPIYPITNVKHAVIRIGFHHLRILALSLSLKDTFPMGKVGNMNYEQFWRVSLYRGLLAKSLANMLKICEPEEAFVGGLTLEIGFLIYFDMFLKGKDDCINLGIYPLESLLILEQEKNGINHREMGEIALQYWKFPDNIINCQRYYGQEEDDIELSGLPRICRIAGKLSALICYKHIDFNEIFHTIVSSYGLDNETVYEVVISALNEVDEISKALQVSVESDKDLSGLMEKANRALSNISEQLLKQKDTGDLPSFDSLRGRDDKSEDIAYAIQAVAHEIRNPLTIVGGFARRLAKTMDPSSDGWKYIEIILGETRRLEHALEEATKGLKA
ncbi:MAG: HDOD domain-containing protein [Proteobacteria bacterium]|nr:HDOD domain-containing protein [Pseudomonadota bacterium]